MKSILWMENEILRERFSKRVKLKLPDIKNRAGALSPKPIKLKLKRMHREQKSIELHVDLFDGQPVQESFLTSTNIEESRHNQSLTPAPNMSFLKNKTHKIRQQTPMLTYDNIVMSKDLAIMAQVRKGVITELTGNRIHNLTPEVLNTLKHQYLPEELKNNENSQQLVQKQKAYRERITRHPFATAAYAIRSLSPQAQRSIKCQLKLSLPHGSRFLDV